MRYELWGLRQLLCLCLLLFYGRWRSRQIGIGPFFITLRVSLQYSFSCIVHLSLSFTYLLNSPLFNTHFKIFFLTFVFFSFSLFYSRKTFVSAHTVFCVCVCWLLCVLSSFTWLFVLICLVHSTCVAYRLILSFVIHTYTLTQCETVAVFSVLLLLCIDRIAWWNRTGTRNALNSFIEFGRHFGNRFSYGSFI